MQQQQPSPGSDAALHKHCQDLGLPDWGRLKRNPSCFLPVQGVVPCTRSLSKAAEFLLQTQLMERYWDPSQGGKWRGTALPNGKENSPSFCQGLLGTEGMTPASLTWCTTCTPLSGTLLSEAASDDQFWAVQVPW